MTDKPHIRPPRARWQAMGSEVVRFWTIGLAICFAGVIVRAAIGPLLIDDAYIYFRYAVNAASGIGLVYNRGEVVFGATSPIYTLLLSLGAMAGLDLVPASVIFGIALDLSSAVVLLIVGRKLGTNLTGWLSALLFSLAPKAVIPGLSGMETSLFTLLVSLSLACLVLRRPAAAIVLAGVSAATRPEGLALLGIVVVYLASVERRIRWPAMLLAALPTMLWLVTSRLLFHAWIPNSINAKAVVFPPYPDPFHDTILVIRYLTNPFEFTSTEPQLGWINLVVLFVGAIGLVDLYRKSMAIRPFVLWCALVGVAYAVVNRSMFPWYLGPFFPLTSIVLASFASTLVERDWILARSNHLFPHAALVFEASALLALGLVLGANSSSTGRAVRLDQDQREAVYLRLGEWFRDHLPPQDVVASVEIGAISYAYRGPVLDLTGLVSPQVLPYYTEPGFVFEYPDTVPPRAVEQLAPPVLVTYDKFIAKMRQMDWFEQAYPNARIVETGHPVYGTLMVFTAPGVPIPPP